MSHHEIIVKIVCDSSQPTAFLTNFVTATLVSGLDQLLFVDNVVLGVSAANEGVAA